MFTSDVLIFVSRDQTNKLLVCAQLIGQTVEVGAFLFRFWFGRKGHRLGWVCGQKKIDPPLYPSKKQGGTSNLNKAGRDKAAWLKLQTKGDYAACLDCNIIAAHFMVAET